MQLKHIRKILILIVVLTLLSVLFACVNEKPTEVALNVDYNSVMKEVEFGTELNLTGLIVSVDLSSGEYAYIHRGEGGYSVNDGGYDCMKAGKYTITVTYKEFVPVVFDISVKEYVIPDDETTNNITGISVKTNSGNRLFSIGEQFSVGNLQINKTYQKTEPVALAPSEYEIDSSDFDGTTAGTYEIKVTYTLGETKFETTYSVKVIALA